MNTLLVFENQTDSEITVNPERPVLDGPIPAELRDPVASQSAEVRLSRSSTTVPPLPATTWVHRLTGDAHSSDLVNFPFAFTAFTILTAGLILIGWGVTVTSEPLAVVGFLLTLVGGSFYGCSLFDD